MCSSNLSFIHLSSNLWRFSVSMKNSFVLSTFFLLASITLLSSSETFPVLAGCHSTFLSSRPLPFALFLNYPICHYRKIKPIFLYCPSLFKYFGGSSKVFWLCGNSVLTTFYVRWWFHISFVKLLLGRKNNWVRTKLR